jgi:hypothetical protein
VLFGDHCVVFGHNIAVIGNHNVVAGRRVMAIGHGNLVAAGVDNVDYGMKFGHVPEVDLQTSCQVGDAKCVPMTADTTFVLPRHVQIANWAAYVCRANAVYAAVRNLDPPIPDRVILSLATTSDDE